MKTLWKLALSVTLATTVSGVALVAPAQAKKEEAAAQAPGFKLSKPVIAVAKNAQDAIAASNFAAAEPLVAQIETSATTDDDKYIAAALRYDLENRKLVAAQTANPKAPVDETTLAKPLDALIAAKSTPAADRGKYQYRRGALAFNGGQYQVASQYFAQAQQAGYSDPNLGLLIVKAKVQGGDVAGGLANLDAELKRQTAAGTKPSEDYYRFGIAKANQQKLTAQTMSFIQQYVAAYPTPKNWRDVIVTYGLQPNSMVTPDPVQRIDLFRLMRATGAMADQYDYEDYAQRVFDRGLPWEAEAVLKEGMAAGKIPATSTSAKSLLSRAQAQVKTEIALSTSETKAKAAATGAASAQTGDAYLGQGNWAKAIALYTQALAKGGVNADEVNTHLGIAQARSGDKAGAAASFAKVQGQPRAGIASLWTASLNAQAPAAAGLN